MNDNIINHFFGSEDQTPVKVKVSLAAAASPAGLLLPDRDPAVSNAYKSCVVSAFCVKIERAVSIYRLRCASESVGRSFFSCTCFS